MQNRLNRVIPGAGRFFCIYMQKFSHAHVRSEFWDSLTNSVTIVNATQDGTSPNGPTDLDMQVAVGSVARKRGTGMENLEGRLQVAQAKTTQDKVEIMSRLQNLIPKEHEKCLTSGALTSYKKYMKKLRACLDSHFTHDEVIDVNGFCAKYPTYSHTKWRCTCSI